MSSADGASGPGSRPDPAQAALDNAQRAAVTAPDGPLLILAGAGSGKTKVLVERTATLLRREDRSVLAITFTNAAADELRSRIAVLTGAAVHDRLTVGTFHAICHRIVRADPHRLGRSPSFSIYDTHASRAAITAALRSAGLHEQLAVALVAEQIGRAKAHLVDAAGYADLARSPRARQIAEAYARYEAALAESDALDFDDLLCGAVALLGDPRLRERYRRRWTAILVDEYQDTNPAQEAWLARLAGERPNLTVVGDPGQAIYGFRAAHVANILGFERRYPGTQRIALARNYRSTATIVRCAARLAAHGNGGAQVRMWTHAPAGPPVTVAAAADENEEALLVATWCRRLLDTGTSAAEIAVLVRTRAQARPIEDALLVAGVACRVLGAPGLWESAIVRDLVAHLTLLCNRRDRLALSRALALQPGIGPAAIARVRNAAAGHDGDLLAACARAAAIRGLTANQRAVAASFGSALVAAGTEGRGLAATVREVAIGCGLVERARSTGAQGEERLEALRCVWRAAREYERRQQTPTLAEFLAQGALGRDDEDAADPERTTLCTLHAAKGAEWDCVHIAGLCEGLLPHHRADDTDEERRLAYVGMTRARRVLGLTWPRRYRGRPMRPSRFIAEAGLATSTHGDPHDQARPQAA